LIPLGVLDSIEKPPRNDVGTLRVSILDSTRRLCGCSWAQLVTSVAELQGNSFKLRWALSPANCTVLLDMLGLLVSSYIDATVEVTKQLSLATKQHLK